MKCYKSKGAYNSVYFHPVGPVILIMQCLCLFTINICAQVSHAISFSLCTTLLTGYAILQMPNKADADTHCEMSTACSDATMTKATS